MKNLIISFVFTFSSFVGFSQKDTNIIDLSVVSPALFSYCDSSINLDYKNFKIPQSNDKNGIELFEAAIQKEFSLDKYKAYVITYNGNTEYISDIWLEVGNGDDSVIIPFCSIIKIKNKKTLTEEYTKVFSVL
jgi:abortive infection bacteriophage resistance protein